MNWWNRTHDDVVTDGALRVLIVEDSEDDTVLLVRVLSQSDYTLHWRRVDTPDGLIDALDNQEWDVILSDYSMPTFSGMGALAVVRARGLDVPFIFVSATIGEDTAVMAMKAGAQDYVMKDRLKRLLPAITRELGEAKIRTERRRAEAMLHDYTERLQLLSHRLLETQERERRHIARELHDQIGQALTAIQINLDTELRDDAPRSRPRLSESVSMIERLLEQVRDLSLSLRPAMLDDLGLISALRWYATQQAKRARFQLKFEADAVDTLLDSGCQDACFRIAQEALTNIARYARAETVVLELSRAGDWLCMLIGDDGVGFDMDVLARSDKYRTHLGLIGMEERASLVGGHIKLVSTPGAGTEVKVYLPLSPLPGRGNEVEEEVRREHDSHVDR